MTKSQLRNRIIRHARSGHLDRAFGLLDAFAEGLAQDDKALLLLRGRLVKERAKRASRQEAPRLFSEASQLYADAVGGQHFSYPLINAASLALLADEKERAQSLAQQALDTLAANPGEAETPYWRDVTRAEALLLLGRSEEAQQALDTAMQSAPRAWEDHAVTIGQFAMICETLGMPADWLEAYRSPRSLHFRGILDLASDDAALKDQVRQYLDANAIGFGFGALAAGADIVIAECLLERGAELHVILPCPRDLFRAQSVIAVDAAWGERFDRLIDAATSLDELQASAAPDAAAVAIAEDVARGIAMHNARSMQSEMLGLAIVESDAAAKSPSEDILTTSRSGGGSHGIASSGQAAYRVGWHAPDSNPQCEGFDNPRAALDHIRHLMSENSAVAADYRYLPEGISSTEQGPRMKAILAVTEAQTVLASKAFAFAAFAHDPSIAIEPFGDVRSKDGVFEAYQISF